MNLEKLKWWKWSLWIRVAGQLVIIYAVWMFASRLSTPRPVTRAELLPWIVVGGVLYVLGRGLQFAAKTRSKRLALEARIKAVSEEA